MLALTYPQEPDTEVSLGSGDVWVTLEHAGATGGWCQLVGKRLDDISGTQAGTAQIQHKVSNPDRKTHNKFILPT